MVRLGIRCCIDMALGAEMRLGAGCPGRVNIGGAADQHLVTASRVFMAGTTATAVDRADNIGAMTACTGCVNVKVTG